MAEGENIEIIYECKKCWSLLPYLSCPHNCPGNDQSDDEEEGFQEDLTQWLEEIKQKMKEGTVRIVEAPIEDVIVQLLPNQPGQQYKEDIRGPRLEGSYHLRRMGEEVPEGVEPLRMVQFGPGEYRPEEEMLREEEELRQHFISLQLDN